MHPTFLAKLRPQDAMFDNDGHYRTVTPSSIPLPAYVNPPHAPGAGDRDDVGHRIGQARAAKAKPASMMLAGTSKPAPTIHAVAKLKTDAAKPETAKPEQAIAQVAAPVATPVAAASPPKATPFDNDIAAGHVRCHGGRSSGGFVIIVRQPLGRPALIVLSRKANGRWPGFVPAVLFIDRPRARSIAAPQASRPTSCRYGWGAASAGGGGPTLVVTSFAVAGAADVAFSLAGLAAGATTTSGRARLVGGASTAGASARCGCTL